MADVEMAGSTYTLSEDGASITCRRCGLTSHNRKDVEQRYCGRCHEFHEARPPGYWMHEQSGALRRAIEAYLSCEPMTREQVGLIREYLRQWIDAKCWDANPHIDDAGRDRLAFLRRMIYNVTARTTIEAWLAAAADIGMDPL